MGKGQKHYLKNGTLHKGGMHKMSDGSLHTGKTHTKTSKTLVHFKDLSKTAQRKRRHNMFALLGSVLGFASSAVPAITDAFAKKQDNKFELEKMRTMAELRAAGYDHDVRMYETMGADNEHDRLIQHDISINQGVGFISGLQKSVRPVITYAFFLLFATIEITLLMEALKAGTNFSEAINVLWDDETKGIFAAILSFWFGSRAIDKARKVK